jgi:hypothetical protein
MKALSIIIVILITNIFLFFVFILLVCYAGRKFDEKLNKHIEDENN